MSTQYKYTVNPTVVVPGTFRNSQWIAQLPQAIYDRDLLRLSIQGPVNSKALCYLGNPQPENLFDQTNRGSSNTADYSGGPVPVPRSSTVTVVWTPLSGSFTGTETVSCTFTVRQGD